ATTVVIPTEPTASAATTVVVTAEATAGGAVVVEPRSSRPFIAPLEPTTTGTHSTLIVAPEPTTGADTTVVVPS
ncbi:hypothetical protein PUR33_00070, partial [Streptomyces sp. BE282]|uniref:hypothetical protein n=1 Tax=Streptomyces sp. BE282 TaxID=3002527 RepID=UPI002E7A154A